MHFPSIVNEWSDESFVCCFCESWWNKRNGNGRSVDSECKYVLWTTALVFLCLNSFWRTVARLIISPMLKHTEQVALTVTRGPLWCSSAQSQAPATHISILYTDKRAFSLPGKFSHERMKCKRLLPHSFLSAHRVVCVWGSVCVCAWVAERDKCTTSSSKYRINHRDEGRQH